KAHGGLEIEKRKITLTRRQTSAIKQADSTGKARTIQVEVRKKRVFVKRDVESEAEVPPAAPVIDASELARREEEERHQAGVAAIKTMMATPKKVVKAPAPEGTLHKPAVKAEAKPVEEKKAGAKEVKSVKLASSWSEDAAKRRTIKTRGDAGAGTAAWRGPKGHRRADEREKSATMAPAESVVRDVSVPETI